MNRYLENTVSLPGVFTYSYLLVLCGVSLVVYFNNREKTYMYYALYTLTLSVYIFSKASMPDKMGKLYYDGVHYVFNYFVQIIFHCFYILFGIHFLNIPQHFPHLKKKVHTYLIILFGVSLAYFGLVLGGYFTVSQYAFYFQLIFIPIHLIVAFYIIYRARSAQNQFNTFFLVGTAAFIFFGIIATLETPKMSSKSAGDIMPITYFYIGVIIEATVFTLGLGLRIRDVYLEKLNVQKELSDTQIKLNIEIKEKLRMKEEAFEKIAQENIIKELETNLYKLQNNVFRSQMNSHFLFNVLNSIKAFIIENNTSEAVSYLNKFSKFIRKVLDGSMHETTSLAEELDTLKLYLQIENVRLSNKLDIRFTVENSLNIHLIKIPTFLLQPFLENAIWHGLAGLDRNQILEVEVAGIDNCVQILILDNGLGYEKALHMKSDTSRQKSYGLALVNERIKQFNESQKAFMSFSIANRNDGVTGTMVSLKITSKENKVQ